MWIMENETRLRIHVQERKREMKLSYELLRVHLLATVVLVSLTEA